MKPSAVKLIPPCTHGTTDCLREVLCLRGVGRLVFEHLFQNGDRRFRSQTLYVPSEWSVPADGECAWLRGISPTGLSLYELGGYENGLLLINARLTCEYRRDLLEAIWASVGTAAAAVEITPELAAPNELVRIGSGHRVVGFRRILEDIAEPTASVSKDWPALLYLPAGVCQGFNSDDRLPLDYETIRFWLAQKGVPLRHYRLGGRCCDMSTAAGLLSQVGQLPALRLHKRPSDAQIAPSARLIGLVWVGRGVRIDANAVVIGPAILADRATVGSNATLCNSIVAAGGAIGDGQRIQNAVCLSDGRVVRSDVPPSSLMRSGRRAYRDWPILSYPRLGKRIFDIIFSLVILMLVSPILVIVALMLKITSPGPIFYVARRQGRHGREFGCLKFRSMMVQADALQERLRVVNEVDGPQFKIDNDPRITGFGKFLRDTCIDELPQFINVLLGQMSVVGPRPSPESENETCPAWRDARLSVRPGITGLWQVCRTRQAGMDFQEWVFYDTQYVRNLSFRKDLWICLKTAQKLINTFLDQFG